MRKYITPSLELLVFAPADIVMVTDENQLDIDSFSEMLKIVK